MVFDFRKSFLIFVFLKLILNQNINLVNLPGVPLLTMELTCNITYALYFFFFLKNDKNYDKPFPLKVEYVFVIFSILVSTIISIVGFSSAITRAIQVIFNNLIFVYILWEVLNTRKDIRLVLNGLFAVFIFLTIYGFFEKFTNYNPLMDYELSLNNSGNVIEWSYSDDDRHGMGRVRSGIIHAIGLGIGLVGLLFLFIVINVKYKFIWSLSALNKIIMAFLGISVIFFTNSRSPLVFMGIIFLPFFSFKKKSTYTMLIAVLIVGIIGFQYIEPYLGNVLSLVSPEKNDSVRGSSIGMRVLQFIAAIYITKGHYFFGLGIKSIDDFIGVESGLLGAESIWLSLLIETGVVGIISHILLMWGIFKMGFGNNKIFITFFTLGWLVLTTITSTPGIGFPFFMTIIVLIVKSELVSIELK